MSIDSIRCQHCGASVKDLQLQLKYLKSANRRITQEGHRRWSKFDHDINIHRLLNQLQYAHLNPFQSILSQNPHAVIPLLQY